MANTKPVGTRMRRATAAQLGTRAPQELTGGFQDLFGSDLEQTLVRLGAAFVRCCARWAAKYDAAGSIWPVARGVGGTEDSYHWNAQSRCEVHWTGVSTNEQACKPGERDQLRQ